MTMYFSEAVRAVQKKANSDNPLIETFLTNARILRQGTHSYFEGGEERILRKLIEAWNSLTEAEQIAIIEIAKDSLDQIIDLVHPKLLLFAL